MTDRNWDAELAKIDKQLSSISDEQLLAEQRAATVPAVGGAKALPGKPMPPVAVASSAKAGAPARPAAGPWASWLKVSIAVAAAAGLMFWPWPARCGLPLVGFTAATGAVTLLGLWSAIGTWRHRLGLAHAASLLVVGWGLALGARETLPRIGYAIPTAERGAAWACEALPAPSPLPSGATPQSGTTPQPGTTPPPASALQGTTPP